MIAEIQLLTCVRSVASILRQRKAQVVRGEIPVYVVAPEALIADASRVLQSDATLATTLLVSARVPHEAGPED